MKKRKLLSILALAVFSVLGASGIAHAQTMYTCDGGGNVPPQNVNGDLVINSTGACTLTDYPTFTAQGKISITAGGKITVNGLTTAKGATGGDITLITTSGDIDVNGNLSSAVSVSANSNGLINIAGTITTNINDQGGNVLLIAQKTIATESIIANGTNHVGGVEIDPQQGGGNALFTVGGSGANAVNGTISSTTVSGGSVGTGDSGGLFITNGTPGSNGGIKVTGADIILGATASQSGLIILQAQSGTLTVIGNLSTVGATGYTAGSIDLIGRGSGVY